jgi:hypothetical protein
VCCLYDRSPFSLPYSRAQQAFNAFRPMSVVERLPLQITSIVTWADKLAVGTKKGVVIAYSVTVGATPDDVSIDFAESHKSFAKKPITQMYAAESHDIMVSTCGR